MNNMISLDDYEQGKLLEQDIRDEVERQITLYNVEPRFVYLDIANYKRLSISIQRKEIAHTKKHVEPGISSLEISGLHLKVRCLALKKDFLYVSGSNYDEERKFYNFELQK